MSYQVWTKSEFEGWQRKDCVDLTAAQGELLAAIQRGATPLLTVEIPWGVNIWIKEAGEDKISARDKYQKGIKGSIKEDKISETTSSKAQPGKGSGAPSEGEVRPGDTTAVPELS